MQQLSICKYTKYHDCYSELTGFPENGLSIIICLSHRVRSISISDSLLFERWTISKLSIFSHIIHISEWSHSIQVKLKFDIGAGHRPSCNHCNKYYQRIIQCHATCVEVLSLTVSSSIINKSKLIGATKSAINTIVCIAINLKGVLYAVIGSHDLRTESQQTQRVAYTLRFRIDIYYRQNT